MTDTETEVIFYGGSDHGETRAVECDAEGKPALRIRTADSEGHPVLYRLELNPDDGPTWCYIEGAP